MAAIYAEISIGGKEDGIGERFGDAHEAGIGEVHQNVRVLLQLRSAGRPSTDPIRSAMASSGARQGAAVPEYQGSIWIRTS